MKPGNLVFEYFGTMYFKSYSRSLDDLTVTCPSGYRSICGCYRTVYQKSHYHAVYRSVFIKNELIDLTGCLDSELV